MIKAEIAANQFAEDQLKKGEIRLNMNFTPLLAHRYLQRQINELCLELYSEKNHNAKFRQEFSSLQTFKFFCEENMHALEDMLEK